MRFFDKIFGKKNDKKEAKNGTLASNSLKVNLDYIKIN